MFCEKIFPLSISMTIQVLLVVLMCSFVCGQDRKITSQLHPGCRACNDEDILVYIKAEGSDDIIHQIWDFTQGFPTVIFAIAGLNSSLSIGWENKKPHSFNMSETPKYSFAAVIDELCEYNDLDDVGPLDSKSSQRSYPLRRMRWHLDNDLLTSSEARLWVTGTHVHDHPFYNDVIEIKMDFLPFQDYAADLPHLIHTANSTLMDISLINLTLSEDYNASRFALHFKLVSTDRSSDSMHFNMRKTLDDEHTPGIFEIIEIKTPESVLHGDGGFLQFRPIAYTQPERSVSASTIAHASDFNRTMLPEHSTISSFYREYEEQHLLVQDLFVSFGEGGDGYYKQHNYTTWSYTFGYGTPPMEGFSLFVILIITLGLAVPVLLALSAGVYLLSRRHRHSRPTRLTNEE